MKPKVYIETTIPSYLAARYSDDIRILANQKTTEEWWQSQRSHFDLFVSEYVLTEVSIGNADASRRRLDLIADIAKLEVTAEVERLTEGAIPRKAAVDAYHLAIAAVNGMDYLLTWNWAHLANAFMRVKIESVCRAHDYEPPIICTPQELMEE
jgi:hypothetical protein